MKDGLRAQIGSSSCRWFKRSLLVAVLAFTSGAVFFAERLPGIYEDNNPWPAPNTYTLDKALGANAGNGYGKYSIYIIVSTDTSVPSMKLTTTGDADYTTGDAANNGLTFPNLGKLKHPLPITITSTELTPPTLYLSELGSMFALEELNVPVTMSIENVTLHGFTADWTSPTWNPLGGTAITISNTKASNSNNTVGNNTASLGLGGGAQQF
jgi:hypothetical protein